MKKMPSLFTLVHETRIFNDWLKKGQPEYYRVILEEPLDLNLDADIPESVPLVTLRCIVVQRVLYLRPATDEDARAIHDWAARHADKHIEDFRWTLELGSPNHAPR